MNDLADRSTEFVKLLAGCERQLTSYIIALVPDFADADEILQETKMRLWAQFDDYDATKSCGAWATKVAYYQIMTYRTKKKREAKGKHLFSLGLVELLSAEARTRAAGNSDRLSALVACLEALGGRSRQMLDQFYGSGKSVREIAEASSLSDHGVHKTLYRSRVRLRDCVERKLGKSAG